MISFNLITSLKAQLQIQSHSEVLGVRTSTCGFEGHSSAPITDSGHFSPKPSDNHPRGFESLHQELGVGQSHLKASAG